MRLLDRLAPRGSLAVLSLLIAAVCTAAPADPDRFSAEQRVTAVDLLVEVQRRIGPYEGKDTAVRLEADDFTVGEDGAERPVVGVESDPDAEPWRLVVWLDLPLADPDTMTWAAGALAERAAELTALGAVEVVLAGAEPRRVLAATRDAQTLALALERIALDPDGDAARRGLTRGGAVAGDELTALRREVSRLLAEPESASALPMSRRELAAQAAAEELRFVRERADLLLLHLLSVAAEPGVGARRALLWVTSGWDADPSVFYRARLEGLPADTDTEASEAQAEPLARPVPDPTAPLARTLAAYGWTTLILAPPVPKPPEWHLRRKAQVALDRLHRPKRGEAFRELGEQRARGGDLEGAESALRRAIQSFYDHPASAQEQALAEAQLADVLDRMGRRQDAERLLARAVQRDPALVRRYPGAAASLVEPLAPLTAVAEATAGRLVVEKEEQPGALDAALASLGRRVRITYQVAGPPDGTLRAVEVRLRAATLRHDAPRWARSGTPERIAEARLRRLAAGTAVDGATLPVGTRWRDGGLEIAVESGAAAEALEAGDAVFRVSTYAPEADRCDHHTGDPRPREEPFEPWRHRVEAAGAGIALVAVEDLTSGRWGWAPVASPAAR